jgi:hypothetical protein
MCNKLDQLAYDQKGYIKVFKKNLSFLIFLFSNFIRSVIGFYCGATVICFFLNKFGQF